MLRSMEVDFTPEQEARLAKIAGKAGMEPACLVHAAALRLLAEDAWEGGPAAELPVLHLGAVKPLHRRDIYEDVV